MTYALEMTEQENALINSYAKNRGISVLEFIRDAVLEKVEDECDRKLFAEALADYQKHPEQVYTLEEVEKHLGLAE